MSPAHTWAEPDLYILADEELIAESQNAVRRLCEIEKHPEPVIVPELHIALFKVRSYAPVWPESRGSEG